MLLKSGTEGVLAIERAFFLLVHGSPPIPLSTVFLGLTVTYTWRCLGLPNGLSSKGLDPFMKS